MTAIIYATTTSRVIRQHSGRTETIFRGFHATDLMSTYLTKASTALTSIMKIYATLKRKV